MLQTQRQKMNGDESVDTRKALGGVITDHLSYHILSPFCSLLVFKMQNVKKLKRNKVTL